jgi:transcriptional regulator with XRE-family HTH domain
MRRHHSSPERDAVLHVVWELQEEADISGTRLAREAGLERVYLQRRLRGEVAFSLEDLVLLAPPLGVTTEDVLQRAARVLRDLT